MLRGTSRGPGLAGSGNSSRSTSTARRASGGRCNGACCPNGGCLATWDGRLCGVSNRNAFRHLNVIDVREPYHWPGGRLGAQQ